MRILVDPANYDLRVGNLGCLAVLQAGLERLAAVFPDARIQVLTTHPDALARHIPSVEPVVVDFRWEWYAGSPLLERCQARLPQTLRPSSARARARLRMACPRTLAAWLRIKGRVARREQAGFDSLIQAVDSADLLVVTGLGGLRGIEVHALRSLQAAIGRGIPTAMLGLGLSGEHSDLLLAAMREVLPKVDVIAVRERRTGPGLLGALGVRPEVISVTGDDAIGLAYRHRPAALGGALGINLRVMRSADVTESAIDRLRPVLHDFARSHSTSLVPLPGANGIAHPDSTTLRALLAGWHEQGDGGISLETPLQVVEQAGRCRLVVTGAYHVAVFALAQGIPAICLAKSAYFTDKLRGLADLFTPGCEVVDMAVPEWDRDLLTAMRRMWHRADELRPGLLQAAEAQNRAGLDVVRSLRSLTRTSAPRSDGRLEPEFLRARSAGPAARSHG